MTIKYKNVPMLFEWQRFAQDCVAEIDLIKQLHPDLTDSELAVFILEWNEHYISALRSWARGKTNEHQRGKIFSMTRFLELCNQFGFDPRKYFVLESEVD